MARRPRNETRPGRYHVWGRGNNRRMIFLGEEDWLTYLRLLEETVVDFGWHCLAYCLMGNHVHLMIETTAPNLGDGMRWLHGEYARQFNLRNGRTNHLFGERYQNAEFTSDEQVREKAQYLALNPVAAGLCQHPEEWAWSSHRHVLDDTAPRWLARDRLLELFASPFATPLEAYRRYMAAPASGPLVLIG